MTTRRSFLKMTMAAAAAAGLPWHKFMEKAYGAAAAPGLSNPADQLLFTETVPNALTPAFKFPRDRKGRFRVGVRPALHESGLQDAYGTKLKTPVFGYADQFDRIPTWPGRTIEVNNKDAGGGDETVVKWENNLDRSPHILPVDTSLHWCYSLHGASSRNGVDYRQFSIAENGVPIITHVHGGHSDFQYDGNPEFFYSPKDAPGGQVIGPQWDFVPGGYTNQFRYDNTVPAGNLWYHDHALGITRLNVYAGLAGFFFVRDQQDTGLEDTFPGLAGATEYELAYAIQDRMFKANGELFYPAFPGDPAYGDFIVGEGADLSAGFPEFFQRFTDPSGAYLYGPTALAEFFGDHMVVNGKIWPKQNVEPRSYRLRLLNGTDSRFMLLQFRVAVGDGTGPSAATGNAIPFQVIGSDQGLAAGAIEMDQLLFEPGSRYDIVINFAGLEDTRVIMENRGGDEPFGGTPGEQLFEFTDRVMAFDVGTSVSVTDSWDPADVSWNQASTETGNEITRKVALFEGMDEYGRLQPLLGTVEADLSKATAYTWFQPTTEAPDYDANEIWEVYNFTGDAHPIHLHLVNFQTLDRKQIAFEENGTVPTIQHNGLTGEVANIENISEGASVSYGPIDGYAETPMKDMVTALPAEVTRIKVSPFDKSGRYVWHCHILSHEDHEMMRVLEVGPAPKKKRRRR